MEDLQGHAMLFLLWLVSTILVRAILAKAQTKARLPPSPPAVPIIGHLHLPGPILHRSFHKISNHYGPLFHLSLGSVPCVVVSSPEIAKEFLKTQETSFANRPHLTVQDYLSYPSADFTFGPYGPYWKFMKKLCMARLLGGQTLDHHLPVRHEEIKRLLRSVLERVERNEPVEIGGELTRLTNNVISRMAVGQRCSGDDSEAEKMRKLVKERNRLIGKFNLSDCIWLFKNLDLQGFRRRAKEFHGKFDAMMEIIREHEEARKEEKGIRGEKVKDLLDILLDISEDENSEIRLIRDHIKAFILDIFVAGTGTTAITIEWALAELINHPKIMNKAVQEIDTIIGKTKLVEESDIPNLPYIQAIVKETLRLHPAAPLVLRESTEDCTVNGYDIAKKTRVFINSWPIGRDPEHWEDPLEFKPERFLSEEGSVKSQLDVRGGNFQLLPFGSGRRSCPGASLALRVVQTSLASMIQCFEWKSVGRENDIVDLEEVPGLAHARAHSLTCAPVARFCPLPL